MKKIYTLTAIILCPLTLSGCDTFRNTFGLDHSSPNEWDTAAPSPNLIIPPDMKLRAPTPGAPNPHIVPETVKAQKTVLGDAPAADYSNSSTKGEQEIIEKASENQEITPDIRKKVDEEAQTDSTVSGKIIGRIQSWKKEASKNLGLSTADQTKLGNDDSLENNQEAEKEENEGTS